MIVSFGKIAILTILMRLRQSLRVGLRNFFGKVENDAGKDGNDFIT